MVDSLAALAFDEAALRLPAAVDSPAALAFNKAWRRPVRGLKANRRAIHGSCAGGLTTHCLLHSEECERDRTNSPGLSLHGRPGGRSRWLVRRLAGYRPLGLGGVETFRALPSERPRHKNYTQVDTTADG